MGLNLSLRLRVVLWLAAIQIILITLLSALYLANAGRVIRSEQEAAQTAARDLVLSTVGALIAEQVEETDLMLRLSERLAPLRHVRMRFFHTDAIERPPKSLPLPDDTPPGWFADLITPAHKTVRLPILIRGRVLGIVLIEGAPEQDITRIWHEFLWLAGCSLAALIALTGLLYWMIGQALSPLARLRGTLKELENGDLDGRVPMPKTPELAPIAAQVNRLAGSLAKADTARLDLARRLTDLQEAERKHIAMELHDEMGPCLFGLSAEADLLARNAPDELRRNAANIQTIVAQLRQINRGILAALRPMTVGQLPLTDVLRDLVASHSAPFPDIAIDLQIGELPATSEAQDLTLYRFVQEAMTNAYRHAETDRISISVTARDGTIHAIVRDYGTASETLVPGTGLRGMHERLRASGGTLTLATAADGGTSLTATLPVEPE